MDILLSESKKVEELAFPYSTTPKHTTANGAALFPNFLTQQKIYKAKTSSMQTSNSMWSLQSENKEKLGAQDEAEPSQNTIQLERKNWKAKELSN